MDDSNQLTSRKRRRLDDGEKTDSTTSSRTLEQPVSPPPMRRATNACRKIPSPFQLTKIHDLPASSNVDAVGLKDILGDPLIAECWEFNYLHDLDFLMDAFDSDVKDLIKVNVVHGFWKTEDASRQRLKVGCYLSSLLLGLSKVYVLVSNVD
jgi:tyrosyl-DNA phosphodiesterase-1